MKTFTLTGSLQSSNLFPFRVIHITHIQVTEMCVCVCVLCTRSCNFLRYRIATIFIITCDWRCSSITIMFIMHRPVGLMCTLSLISDSEFCVFVLAKMSAVAFALHRKLDQRVWSGRRSSSSSESFVRAAYFMCRRRIWSDARSRVLRPTRGGCWPAYYCRRCSVIINSHSAVYLRSQRNI